MRSVQESAGNRSLSSWQVLEFTVKELLTAPSSVMDSSDPVAHCKLCASVYSCNSSIAWLPSHCWCRRGLSVLIILSVIVLSHLFRRTVCYFVTSHAVMSPVWLTCCWWRWRIFIYSCCVFNIHTCSYTWKRIDEIQLLISRTSCSVFYLYNCNTWSTVMQYVEYYVIGTAHSMWSRVCVTVQCPSVCPVSPLQQRVAGLLLSARRVGDIDRLL